MSATPKHTVFISHSSLNQAVTDELYTALTGRFHLVCWMDAFDLHADKGPFTEQIVDAIRASKMMVLVNSPAARNSDYVNREIQLGKDLQLPVQRCSIDENQPNLLRKIKILWLALNIYIRLIRPLIFAASILTLILSIMVAGITLLGKQILPIMTYSNPRDLPAAILPTTNPATATALLDPKVAAPFHFAPGIIFLNDDFGSSDFENKINEQMITYDIFPRNLQVKVGQQNSSLVLDFPVECLSEEIQWDCEMELDSNVLDSSAIQYFGFRARTVERTSLRGISVSLSINEPNRSRAGFGWNFAEHAMAFFRSIPSLPERDLYAYVTIDSNWHAYEILQNTQKPALYYYVDGQLVATYTPIHTQEWAHAPQRLIIYSMKDFSTNIGEQTGTHFELDEFIIGAFRLQ